MSQEIDHDNAERLAALLNILAAAAEEDEEAIPIDTLDGYLTALVCGPVLAAPVQAMDALFGEDWPAALEEQEVLDEFMTVLHERWNEIADALEPEALSANPDEMRLTPMITEFDEATKASLLSQGVLTAEQLEELPAPGVMWAEGFMQAVDDMETEWYAHEADSESGQMLDALLMAIAAVAMPEGEQREAYIAEAYEPDDEVDQDVLLDDALYAAQDLRLFWLQSSGPLND
ncbi:UPF0149 family protein [Paucibacter sp. APW11]|uniref:UPF0149 family protein n=1 Tax=Roseateles aquae TaxID=3077235 RepID=A0ABU3PGC2_9BURK|nr:UPF0149 family protein [Paucibacter sp. APW11]MDT9001377.1 UPF0149 family protein [Paucibacter sp. APW11]